MVSRRIRKIVLLVGIAGLTLAQFLRPSLDNPPLSAEPTWDSPRTRELARAACFDCHSNETRYPWYSQVAPVRWWIHYHVADGRRHLNFSQVDPDLDVDALVEVVRADEMPPADYRWMHPAARLTPGQKDSLVAGFLRTFLGGDSSAVRAAFR